MVENRSRIRTHVRSHTNVPLCSTNLSILTYIFVNYAHSCIRDAYATLTLFLVEIIYSGENVTILVSVA